MPVNNTFLPTTGFTVDELNQKLLEAREKSEQPIWRGLLICGGILAIFAITLLIGVLTSNAGGGAPTVGESFIISYSWIGVFATVMITMFVASKRFRALADVWALEELKKQLGERSSQTNKSFTAEEGGR